LGDPLRTSFAKTNNNFSQLFATAGVSGIANGSSNVNIPQANGNVVISSAGFPNVLIVAGNAVYSTGTLNSTGLATLSNLSVTGTIISTGTIQSLADVTAVTVTASGNLSANNAVITNNISAGLFTGNGAGLTGVIAAGNVGAASQLTNGTTTMNIPVANGNMIGNVGGVTNIFTLSTSGLGITGIVSASGNVTGGNLRTGGLISATGNIVGNYILGNGASLTGVITSVANINNGTSNVTVVSSGGNIEVGVSGNANVTVFSSTGQFVQGTISASGNIQGDTFLTGGVVSATGNITGGNLVTGGQVSASGNILAGGLISATANITGGNILTGGLISAAGNVTTTGLTTTGAGGAISGTGNITGGNFITGGLINATGNITGGNLTVGTGTVTAGNIVNANGNAVGNIGSSSKYFNQVFAQATTALYADLAEVYSADADYLPGTVVVFGGSQEVTVSTVDSSRRVAGVISEKPSYLMNSGLQAEHRAVVALTGRVPTQVIGPIAKGDMMVSTNSGRARAEAEPMSGAIIGKALEDFDGLEGTIEIVVGRL
jgi:hypothetical protein